MSAVPGPVVLEARGLSAGYGPIPVVKALDLSVRAGEIVTLLGANGAGKTTTLMALAGLLPPSQGEVLLLGRSTRAALHERMLWLYTRLDDFLREHAPQGPWLFDAFGWAEAVFTPMFMRFWFLDYYEGFELPADGRLARVRAWRDTCLAHPAAQQVCREEIVKLYYDYAQGLGNGALAPGRQCSSFVFEPHWRERPWPPRDKYGHHASDAELGL